MSVKIYEGYVLPAYSFFELQQFVDNLREKLTVVKDKLIHKAIAHHLYSSIDDVVFDCVKEEGFINRFRDIREIEKEKEISDWTRKNILTSSFISLAANKVADLFAEIHRTQQRNPFHDFRFSVVFIGGSDKTYAIVYTEQKEYLNIWKEMKGVEFYPYWNNTDPLEGCSYEDWCKRGDEWEKVLHGYKGPGLIGFSVDLMDETYLPIWGIKDQDVLAQLPSLEERALKIARRKAESIMMDRLKTKNPEYAESDNSIRCYMEAERRVRKSPEGQELCEQKLKEITPFIVEITPEIARMKFPEFKKKFSIPGKETE